MNLDIDIVGGTRLQKQLIRSASKFYLHMLGCSGAILLTIRLKKDFFKKYGAKADCMMFEWDEDYVEFEIRIDAGMNIPAILRCLAHETVHVQQYYSKRMVDGENYHEVLWNRKKIDTRNYGYYDLPWEVEAYSKETGLYELFVAAKRLSGKRWYKDYDFA